jgi:plasmid stabilization system protein ParE
MSAELIIAPEAQQDVDEAYCWYEDRRPGLGEEFLSCVDACIQAICRTPDLYSIVHDEYRRALVRRFPYAVCLEFFADTVTV